MEKNLQVGKAESIPPAEMIKQAVSGGADLDKLKGLLELQRDWEAGEAKKAYHLSMATVNEKMPSVAKTLKNPQTQSKYAALDKIIEAIKPIYTKEGFSLIFYEGETERPEHIRIMANVSHRRGHTEVYHYDVPLDGVGIKGNPNMTKIHAKASSTSYGRRYLTCMIFNVPTGDDNDAQGVGVEHITDKQASEICDILDNLPNKETKPKFLKFMKVEKIEDIKSTDYKKASAVLADIQVGKKK